MEEEKILDATSDFIVNNNTTLKPKTNSNKKKKKRSYKFSNKKHSIQSIIAFLLGIISIIITIICIYKSSLSKGNGSIYLGVFALVAFLISIIGFVMAIKDFNKSDIYRIFTVLGALTNAILIIFFCALYVVGMI